MTIHGTKSTEARMSCADAVRVLWDYLDGELDEARREQVRTHLAECDHCRGQYTFEGAFLRAVDRLIDEPIDVAALRARVVRALGGLGGNSF